MQWKTYLLAVISSISATHKVLIGPAIQVGVLSTQETISSITSPTLALVHWVTEVTDVDTLSIFVTVVGLVLAWIFWFTDLMRNIQADIEFVADVPFNAFVITLCFVVDCTSKLSYHFSLTCALFFWKDMTNWGPKPSQVNVIFKEILDKVQTGAFLCKVYFMKSHLMDRTSYYGPLLCLHRCTKYSQLPLITRKRTKHSFRCHFMSSWSRVTARTALWSKLWNGAP